jgi:hypothetical protein
LQLEAKLKELELSQYITLTVLESELGVTKLEDAEYLKFEDLRRAGILAGPARKFVALLGKNPEPSSSLARNPRQSQQGDRLIRLQERLSIVAAAKVAAVAAAKGGKVEGGTQKKSHFPMSSCFLPEKAKTKRGKAFTKERQELEKRLKLARNKEREEARKTKAKKKGKGKGKQKGKQKNEEEEEEDILPALVSDDDDDDDDEEIHDSSDSSDSSPIVVPIDFSNQLAKTDNSEAIQKEHQQLLQNNNWQPGGSTTIYQKLYEQARQNIIQRESDSAPRSSAGRPQRSTLHARKHYA